MIILNMQQTSDILEQALSEPVLIITETASGSSELLTGIAESLGKMKKKHERDGSRLTVTGYEDICVMSFQMYSRVLERGGTDDYLGCKVFLCLPTLSALSAEIGEKPKLLHEIFSYDYD